MYTNAFLLSAKRGFDMINPIIDHASASICREYLPT
jgi:hypothetical protein